MKILNVINQNNIGGAESVVKSLNSAFNENAQFISEILYLDENKYKQPNKKTKSLVLLIRLIFQYRSILKKVKENNIILIHLFPGLYFFAFIILRIGITHPIFIYVEHSTKNDRRKYNLLRIFESYIYNKYDHIVCVNDLVKENLLHWIPAIKDKISVIYNGVDISKLITAEVYSKNKIHSSLKENDILITMIANFTKAKDHKTAIDILKFLPSNYKLILVGVGELQSHFKAYAASESELKERVIFLDSRNDISSLILTSDINILTSKWEGLSIAALECLAIGKPFLATNCPGLNNLVKDVCPNINVGDTETFAREILLIKNNEAQRKALIIRCMDKSKQFDLKNTAQNYFRLFQLIAN